MEWYLPRHLGRDHRLRGRDVCDPRRLRSRHRHPVSVRRSRARARPDDEFRRAVLGRQRDLAGARRRRTDGRLSAGLRDHPAGALSARHLMLLALVFRGVAFEFRWIAVTSKRALDFRVRCRLDACRLLPGRDPRRADPGHQSGERRVCRRRLRLGDAVRGAVRPGLGGGLCPARRHLARS